MTRKERYLKILDDYKDVIDYYTPACELLSETKSERSTDKTIQEVSALVIGPTMISFALWLLESAKTEGIKKLYFLARDGYLLKKIAEEIIKSYDLDIVCEYLYCSRLSLRKPLFYINEEEFYNYLYEEIVELPLNVLLNRMNLDDSDTRNVEKVFKKSIAKNDNDVIKKEQLVEFIENNEQIKKILLTDSRRSFQMTTEYFRQCGMLEEELFAVVDSGWNGSVQKCLGLLIKEIKKQTIVVRGYYFGILSEQPVESGIFNSFYFNGVNNARKSVYFNHDLFEAICSANSGMTLGYEKQDSFIRPVLGHFKFSEIIELQIEILLKLTDIFCKRYKLLTLSDKVVDELVFKLMKEFMFNPSKEEAEVYGNILFSESVTDDELEYLTKKIGIDDLIKSLLIYKIYGVMTNKKSKTAYWLYGSIALSSNKLLKGIIKMNGSIWIYCKLLVKMI